jgi:glutathione-regulated potassium-efflux system ancillary protein KefC
VDRHVDGARRLLGQNVLRQLGYGAFRARQAAQKFRNHNIKSLHAVYPYYKDQEQSIAMARQARDALNEMFARDLEALQNDKSAAWHQGDGHP